MNSNAAQFSVISPIQWQLLEFAIFGGMFLLIATGTLIWFFFFRKRRRRVRKSRSERSQLNPTLAQKGGLPPVRRADRTFGETPPPMP